MKRRLLVCAVVALSLSLAALFVRERTSARTHDKTSVTEVQVDNFSFGPGTINVPVNSIVTWVNKDDIPHTVASTDGLFKSRALDTDDQYSYTFTKAGTYSYYCSIHPKMTGKVVVR